MATANTVTIAMIAMTPLEKRRRTLKNLPISGSREAAADLVETSKSESRRGAVALCYRFTGFAGRACPS
ncbi:hypothetical protein [Streptosporangium carneum]|uniref:hypothetical protein n=1 Tax=Streptosporangium carneum TaxID=47481 RepID=UPI0022F31F17|nr:hypothetical protein [Streptosporangium carneum]